MVATKIVPSYVSASVYYGYVAPTINEVLEDDNNCLEAVNQNPHYNNYLLAMETEEVYVNQPNCQNNHCVIPETVRHLNNNNNGGVIGALSRPIINGNNNVTINSRNRKRNYDDPDHDPTANGIKKFRKVSGFRFRGSGNNHVFHGTTTEQGSTAMCNESSTLCLVPNKTSLSKPNSNDKYYPQAAGNYLFKNPTDTRELSQLQLNQGGGCKIKKTTYLSDVEEMLMQTHGCSAYHHCHDGTNETEF